MVAIRSGKSPTATPLLMRGVLQAFVITALFMDGDGRGLHDKATLTAVVRR